jgi:hypothetical protein
LEDVRHAAVAIAWGFLLALCLSCGGGDSASRSRPESIVPAPPRLVVDAEGGTPKRGPGELYNACERVWCLAHQRNFPLDHFLRGHVGWILHDDGHGDVFVPRERGDGIAFPQARSNVLRLCGRHVHPAFLGAHPEPVTRPGYNLALGYDRSHFSVYGTQVPPCCLNEQGWGFLHAGSPREYRFGDRTSSAEMAGSGWQKAFPTAP